MTIAYCLTNGIIGFASDIDEAPDGAVVFASGIGDDFQENVEAKARLAYDGKRYLVPGVPEAQTAEEGFTAFSRWQEWAFPGQPYTFVLGHQKGGAS